MVEEGFCEVGPDGGEVCFVDEEGFCGIACCRVVELYIVDDMIPS